jgi:hypothetical protein
MRLVCSLAEFGQGDGAMVGGKGANLGELLQAGLPVPPVRPKLLRRVGPEYATNCSSE